MPTLPDVGASARTRRTRRTGRPYASVACSTEAAQTMPCRSACAAPPACSRQVTSHVASSSTPPATPQTNGHTVAPVRAHHAHCLVLGSSAILLWTRGHEQVTELGL